MAGRTQRDEVLRLVVPGHVIDVVYDELLRLPTGHTGMMIALQDDRAH